MLVDTHCHLDFSDYDKDRASVINKARQAGVGAIINIGTSIESTRRSIELAEQFDFIFATVGAHPHYVGSLDGKGLDTLRELSYSKKVVAIGEVGLDYFKSEVPFEIQKSAFLNFISISKERKLPLIVHDRDAHKDILEILKKEFNPPIKAVIHCFSGDKDFLKECLDLGLFVSFTCNITYKKAESLRELARLVPLERLFLETDAPFLSPQNLRGKRNEPSNLSFLAGELARIKGLDSKEIADITTDNAKKFFNLNI